MRTWVNGSVVDDAEATVSAFDHGVTVGDGVFETLKVVGGTPFAMTRHLERLAFSARGLGLPDPDLDVVRRAVAETLAANDVSTGLRLRITLTAGVSPLGSDRGDAEPTLMVALAPLKTWPPTAAVATVGWTRNERSATAGLKTTSYAENVVALADAHARGAAEAVLANTAGHLCEGTGSNVFLVLGGELVTPPLSSGCLAGVTRGLVLEWCDATERDLGTDALWAADEVFLTSSTRDVQPVHAVDDHAVPAAPGPVTTRVAAEFARRAAADIDP
ncbi:MAG: aminotransferase class IV [Actinomycetes bacterium]